MWLWLHRWLGVGLFALMLGWFGSGLVMLFARYPHLSEADRLAALRPLVWADLAGPAALAALPEGPIHAAGVRLRRDAVGPHFLYQREGHSRRAAAGSGGAGPVQRPTRGQLRRLARTHLRAPVTATDAPEAGDQWTLAPFYAQHYPLLRVTSTAGEVVHVSRATGEVVQRTTRRARLLAWLGPIPHWWYPQALRERAALWEASVAVGAGSLLVLCAIGLGLGLWRLRQPGRPSRHALLGLAFGIIACTWTLSGALSVNPLGLLPGPWSVGVLNRHLQGEPLAPSRYTRPVSDALAACVERIATVKELELIQLAGKPIYLCKGDDGRSALTDAVRAGQVAHAHFDRHSLRAALAAAPMQGFQLDLASLELTDVPDAFHHPDAPDSVFPRPFGRIDVGGARAGVAYLDVYRGRFIALYDAAGLRHHYLFHVLHTWDVAGLWGHPNLRRGLMGVALLGGIWLGWSGTQLAWRRLRRAFAGASAPPA